MQRVVTSAGGRISGVAVRSRPSSACVMECRRLYRLPQWRLFACSSSAGPRSTAAAAAVSAEVGNSPEEPIKRGMDKDDKFHTLHRTPMVPFPQSPTRSVPPHIVRPPYAATGRVPPSQYGDQVLIHTPETTALMRDAARWARRALDVACGMAQPGVTTDEIDAAVHDYIVDSAGAYPSPLNYAGFPKSLCASVNEVICHGIPDTRPLAFGDVVSFDVSCFVQGVHGDNCATVIVGDTAPPATAVDDDTVVVDWRGMPQRAHFTNAAEEEHFARARQLVQATRESLYAAIATVRPGSCLSDIGNAIHDVADAYGVSTVEKYRGHGIADEFHCAPFVKHYRNQDRLSLVPGMIFTIEPMLCAGSADCFEWDDEWTVATVDGSMAAQFEHTVLVTEDGVEILTLPE